MLHNKLNKLTVKYNSRTIGYLVALDNYKIAFQYDDNWLNDGFSISPFSLPLSNKIYINDNNIFDGLYGVFFDSLPDGWGILLKRKMLNKIDITYDKLSPLDKLSLISKNGLGGLEFEPSNRINNMGNNLSLDEISLQVDRLLNDDSTFDLDSLYNLGGSSGGARPKVHVKYDDGEWIIKFKSHLDQNDIGKKEYEANMLAKRCDININECKLFPSSLCKGYFGSKRFDRVSNYRLHMISLSSLLETSHRLFNLDYYHLFSVIEQISYDKKKDLYEAFKRMCFNVFFGNKDDHGKNFSFLYNEKEKGYELSPFYDITYTPNLLEHAMTINGKGSPEKEDLLDIAKVFHLSNKECQKIMNNIESIVRKNKKS